MGFVAQAIDFGFISVQSNCRRAHGWLALHLKNNEVWLEAVEHVDVLWETLCGVARLLFERNFTSQRLITP